MNSLKDSCTVLMKIWPKRTCAALGYFAENYWQVKFKSQETNSQISPLKMLSTNFNVKSKLFSFFERIYRGY